MKKERLLHAMSEIGDDLITEAAPEKKEKIRKFPYKWISAAACLALAAILGAGIWQSGVSKLPIEPFPELKESGNSFSETNDIYQRGENNLIVKKWSEMTPKEQYNSLKFNSFALNGRYQEIPAEKIGALLGSGTAEGFDRHKNVTHAMNAAVYEILGVSRECAVAAQLEGRSDYFVYVNCEYQPETLGDFIRDLNLKENMSFGFAYYSPEKGDPDYTEKGGVLHEYTDLTDEKIWEMLLSDETAPAVPATGNEVYKMYMGMEFPLLGYSNMALGVTEDGYLLTNILDTQKMFYIGTEKTEAFVSYVRENCEKDRNVYRGCTGIRLYDNECYE